VAISIGQERQGGVLIVSLSGRLDNESAADFELFVQEALAAGERHLLLDLADLGYMSNAGIRAVGTLAKSLNTPTTSLRVSGVAPAVRQVLDAAGVGILLDIRADRAAALADHPAAVGADLGREMLRLLGVESTPVPAPEGDMRKLAELAFELLSAGDRHQQRAARAQAQGTQVMRRITPPASGAAATPPATPAQAKPSFWQRLFGRKPR